MSNLEKLLERSLRRDALMRSAGRTPTPIAESRLIELIVEHSQFAEDHVREWLRLRSVSDNYWVMKALLSCVWPLMSTGFSEDAAAIFGNIVGVHDGDDARNRRRQIFGGHSGLDYLVGQIVKREDIPANATRTWGMTLIQLLSRLLEDDRGESSRRHSAREESDGGSEPESFDYHHYSFYSPHRRDSRDWTVVASAAERAMNQACSLSDGDVFRELAAASVAAGSGLAMCQPLVSLFDYVRCRSSLEWHKKAALDLLANREIERKYATISWRRLLRRELLPHTTEEERAILVNAVRQYQADERCRLNELSDFSGFVTLTSEEEEAIGNARAEGTLYNTSDSREALRFTASGFRDEDESERSKRWELWPYESERELLRELIQSEKRNEEQAYDASTFAVRTSSLSQLLAHAESKTPQWFPQFLRCSTQFLVELKKSCRIKHSLAPSAELDSNIYLSALSDSAPWWHSLAQSSLAALGSVSSEDSSDDPDIIFWSSDDLVACSCAYLDELLATLPGTPIDELRHTFRDKLVSVWPTWSTYTRFVAIANIRTFHWRSSAQLSSLLEDSVTTSTHSQGIGLALEHLLRGSGHGVARVLQILLERLDQLSDPSETARIVGRVIGDAVMRHSGDHEETLAVAEIAGLYPQVQATPLHAGRANSTFVAAMCEGAREHASGLSELTDDHAATWLGMMQWALQTWLRGDAEARNSLPFSLGAAVYETNEIGWTVRQQSFLMQGLVSLLHRVLREAELGGFYEIHYEFRKTFKLNNDRVSEQYSLLPDATWLSFCSASATRVADWRRQNRTTNDIAYIASLTGENTSDLIKGVFAIAGDKASMRRELAPIIDILADAGLHEVATQLRTWVRTR